MNKRFHKPIKIRTSKAFSLVTVTIVGLLATMWLTATTASMVAVYENTNQSRYESSLLSAAESATDYVIARLNDPSSRSKYDAKSTYKSSTITSLDGTSWGAPADSTVNVTVTNVSPTYDSYLFDPQLTPTEEIPLVPTRPMTQNWSLASRAYAWRLVQTTATFGSYQKSIVVALKPVYASSKIGTSVGPSTFFNTGATATGALYFGNQTVTSAIDSSKSLFQTIRGTNNRTLGGDVAAYNSAVFNGGVTIGGELTVPSMDPSTKAATGLSSNTVNRYVTTSGTQSGFSSTNVLGESTSSSGDFPPDNSRASNVVTRSSTVTQSGLPPAPTAPLNSSGQLDSSVKALTSTSSPSSSIAANTNVTMQPGDYYASSFSVGLNSSVSLSNTSAPVRMFIDGSNNASSVVQIIGNVNNGFSTNAANFQIWYNGTGTVEIRSPQIKATVYAPNATVLLGANQNSSLNSTKGNSTSNFTGAIVAKNIIGDFSTSGSPLSTTKLNFKVDRALLSGKKMTAAQASSLTFDPSTYAASPATFQIASYTESRAVIAH